MKIKNIITKAKPWWAVRLCYNKEDEADPFKYLTLFETGGQVVLGLLSRDEVYSVLVNFVDKNLEEIRGR